MEHCICGRTFMTLDGAEQHMKGTKRKDPHKLKTSEEIEADRKQRWKEFATKYERLAFHIDMMKFNQPSF